MSDKLFESHERAPLPGAHSVGKSDPSERFEVTLILRRNSPDEFAERVRAAERGERAERTVHSDFETTYGASHSDIAAVTAFAAQHDLSVTQVAPARRAVILSGTVAQFRAAFGIDFETFEHPNGTYRGRIGAIVLPANLQPIVEAVLGLDNRPQAKPHFRIHTPRGNVAHDSTAAAAVAYEPPQVASIYGFPAGTGAGQCIALIELGGGFRPADLKKYFSGLNISPLPSVTAVSVDHAANKPTGSADGPDGEVMLDIEVACSIAPGAHIVVYFAPNTDAGFLNAVATAIHDTTNKPSIVSISWGSAESSWEPATMTAFDEAFQSAATLGITVCVASGDNGSSDDVAAGKNHVDFPASSPHALACGGTSLRVSGTPITRETAWNDGAGGGATGGGESTFFALPDYQTGCVLTSATGTTTPLTMRGVPDVAGDADPETGYDVLVDGKAMPIGGTSAVAPLWASLIALSNTRNNSTAGFINGRLYANRAALRDVTSGNNSAYAASDGWDATTGLGSPIGAAVATAVVSRELVGNT